jgi:mRNA interferase MazF
MRRGTVVLTPFPFTDLSGQKVRPALVVSRSDRPGTDVLLAFITSKQSPISTKSDLLVDSSHPDFAQTGLKMSSVVKLDKLVTVEYSVILGELGEFSEALLQEVNEKLRYVLELEAHQEGQNLTKAC